MKKNITNQAIFKNSFMVKVLLFAKRFKYRTKISEARKRCKKTALTLNVPFFFFDNGRVAENIKGEKISFYFNKIEEFLGSQKCVTIYQVKTPLKKGEALPDLHLATLFNSYSSEDKTIIKALKKTYFKMVGLNIFAEQELFNIRVAINKFFDEYRFWKSLLSAATIKIALFDEHYHREGFILALKQKNINVVELQHGLIAPEDVFYVFPEAVSVISDRAFFPDKIFTYGSYWSDILKKGFEFKQGQIEELGVYQELNTYVDAVQKEKLVGFINNEPVIVITTQTFLHAYFIQYIQWLSSDLLRNLSPVKIIVKNHPSEKIELYSHLEKSGNVKVVSVNTEYLLSICSWHISCYSTTLYDATKYNCRNFSLLIENCTDYINTFVREGISDIILKNQNPVFFPSKAVQAYTFDKRTLYENFDAHKHKLNNLLSQ